MSALVDLTGKKFGLLTTVERAENRPGRKTAWVCLCDCGREIIARSEYLKNGQKTSCGHDKSTTNHKLNCPSCGIERNEENCYKLKRSSDGLSYKCRSCTRADERERWKNRQPTVSRNATKQHRIKARRVAKYGEALCELEDNPGLRNMSEDEANDIFDCINTL